MPSLFGAEIGDFFQRERRQRMFIFEHAAQLARFVVSSVSAAARSFARPRMINRSAP